MNTNDNTKTILTSQPDNWTPEQVMAWFKKHSETSLAHKWLVCEKTGDYLFVKINYYYGLDGMCIKIECLDEKGDPFKWDEDVFHELNKVIESLNGEDFHMGIGLDRLMNWFPPENTGEPQIGNDPKELLMTFFDEGLQEIKADVPKGEAKDMADTIDEIYIDWFRSKLGKAWRVNVKCPSKTITA